MMVTRSGGIDALVATLQVEGASGVSSEAMPYRRLAAAVINAAVSDFGGWPERMKREHGMSPVVTKLGRSRGLAERLVILRQQIAAGRFLIERDDECAMLWFALADLDRQAFRRHEPWARRLAAMRSVESDLTKKLALQRRAEYGSKKPAVQS